MITIALADDDALVRRTLTELLDVQDGITVAWAARDGQEALDKVRDPDQPQVQALLLDVQMPGLDGISVAETLHAESPEIAVLILTTFMADPIVDRAMAAGVRGFIAKEDPIASIAGAIQQAVDGNMVLSPTSSAILGQRLSGPTAPGGGSPVPRLQPVALEHGVTLSSREMEVLALMVEAMSNKQIARRLGISEATVKTHVSTLIAKLGVQDRVSAAVYALRHGIL